jgi:hypothetical protein
MATSFGGGRSWCTRREPTTMGKQLDQPINDEPTISSGNKNLAYGERCGLLVNMLINCLTYDWMVKDK